MKKVEEKYHFYISRSNNSLLTLLCNNIRLMDHTKQGNHYFIFKVLKLDKTLKKLLPILLKIFTTVLSINHQVFQNLYNRTLKIPKILQMIHYQAH